MLYVKHNAPSSSTDFLFKNNPFIEALFSDAPDAVFILDGSDYSILDCNSKALDMFEVESKASIVSLPSFRLYESELTDSTMGLLEKNMSKVGEHTQEMVFRSFKQNVFWGKLKKRSVAIEGKKIIVLRVSKTIDYLRTEEAMTQLLQGTARVTGKKYFKELTRLLCKTFDVRISFVGKLSNNKEVLELIESYGPIEPDTSFELQVKGSLIENTVRGYTSFYPKGTKELFPNDTFAANNEIEGFMCTPVYGNAGEVVGVIGIVSNGKMEEMPNSRHILSFFASRTAAEFHRMRSKALLKEQAEKLAEANSVKDKLLSVISHDLMNPLHSVMGYSELLHQKMDSYTKEEMIERIELIDNSIKNIYFLLENVKGWINIYNNKVNPRSERIPLARIIHENLDLFRYVFDLKKLTIHANIDDFCDVVADKQMLGIIIRNLLSNAVKYTPKGGAITIRVDAISDQIRLMIQDNGIGMNFDTTESVLNADKIAGSGMGLMLAQQYSEWLHVDFQLNSQPEQGTTCMVSFPKELKVG